MSMIRVGDRVYTALTPEQRKLKQDYLLQQQVANNEVPSFETVAKEHEHEVDRWAADYAADLYRVEADDDDVLVWLEDHDLLPDEGDEEQLDELIKKHRETVSEELSMKQAREYVLEEIESEYDEAVYRIEHELPGSYCWRHVVLPESVDPLTHTDLGVYWSYDEDAAQAHWPGKGRLCKYMAEIDSDDYIDKAGTIWANTYPGLGDEEKEVRFLKGAPIYVIQVEFKDDYGEWVNEPVDDWRRC